MIHRQEEQCNNINVTNYINFVEDIDKTLVKEWGIPKKFDR